MKARALAIAGLAVLAAVGAAALARPDFFRLANTGGRVLPPPCPAVLGAEPVKTLPCLTRVVRGLPPPHEAAGPEPASRGEP